MIFRKLRMFFYDLSRAFSLFRSNWGTVDYDFDGGLRLLAWHLDRLQKHMQTHQTHIGSERSAKEIRIVLEHLKRYHSIEDYHIGETPEDILHYIRTCTRTQNTRILELEDWHFKEAFRRMGNKMQHWWD